MTIAQLRARDSSCRATSKRVETFSRGCSAKDWRSRKSPCQRRTIGAWVRGTWSARSPPAALAFSLICMTKPRFWLGQKKTLMREYLWMPRIQVLYSMSITLMRQIGRRQRLRKWSSACREGIRNSLCSPAALTDTPWSLSGRMWPRAKTCPSCRCKARVGSDSDRKCVVNGAPTSMTSSRGRLSSMCSWGTTESATLSALTSRSTSNRQSRQARVRWG